MKTIVLLLWRDYCENYIILGYTRIDIMRVIDSLTPTITCCIYSTSIICHVTYVISHVTYMIKNNMEL